MWIAETPWPVILVVSVLVVLLALRWRQRRTAMPLVGIGVLIAIAIAAFFVERSTITERERIELNVFGVTDAFREEDFDRCWSYFSPNAKQLKEVLRTGMQLVDVSDDLRITDLDVKLLSENSRATSHFRANATISSGTGSLGRKPSRWELTWQLENGDWKIIRVTRLDPINGEELETTGSRHH